ARREFGRKNWRHSPPRYERSISLLFRLVNRFSLLFRRTRYMWISKKQGALAFDSLSYSKSLSSLSRSNVFHVPVPSSCPILVSPTGVCVFFGRTDSTERGGGSATYGRDREKAECATDCSSTRRSTVKALSNFIDRVG